MKKGETCIGTVKKMAFPNRGIVEIDGETAVVKNALPGQTVEFLVQKKRGGRCEGRLLQVTAKSILESEENPCPHFGICGGCIYQSIPYREQLRIKEQQVRELLGDMCPDGRFEGIKASPLADGYRNKMEFSFGDEMKGGPLTLGLHKRGSFHDVVNVDHCRIVHPDFTEILRATREYFASEEMGFYRKLQHIGYLRHLLVRRAVKTGEILVALVTSGQTAQGMEAETNLKTDAKAADERVRNGLPVSRQAEQDILEGWKDRLLALPLAGSFAGILHLRNDSPADVVQSDETAILYGREYFYEELLGLKFKISPFSFFQTNSLGAEVLYQTAREYVGDTAGKMVFDLYSGTGTIAQMLAPVAEKVIGVEIVEEAVAAARENAARNGLNNCEFIAGDVMKVLRERYARRQPGESGTGICQAKAGGMKVEGVAEAEGVVKSEGIAEAEKAAEVEGAAEAEKAAEVEEPAKMTASLEGQAADMPVPDIIVLDPPRDGIHPKALEQIGCEIQAKRMVYISCKPTSLARDLEKLLKYGYQVERVCCVDMFPGTGNVETVVSLSQ